MRYFLVRSTIGLPPLNFLKACIFAGPDLPQKRDGQVQGDTSAQEAQAGLEQRGQ